MSTQTAAHSPEFQALIVQVETALVQAAVDARELAERTGTPLVVRTPKGQESLKGHIPAESRSARKKRH